MAIFVLSKTDAHPDESSRVEIILPRLILRWRPKQALNF